jgi:hypothetical protein
VVVNVGEFQDEMEEKEKIFDLNVCHLLKQQIENVHINIGRK